MKRLPSPSTRYAPAPRSASDTSGCCAVSPAAAPRNNAVGWNWTNSMSVTAAPARNASATPSPVDTTGFVVTAKIWPMPPVASTTARAWIAPTPSSLPSPSTCRVTPQARPVASVSRSRTSACSTRRIHGSRRTASCSARCTSAPVASPPAWTTRSAWWPPSRVSISVPSGYRSNSAPQRISSRTRAGPSVTSTSTAAGSLSPTPATRVSSACAPGVTSGPSTAAMPPWAHRVEPSSMLTLVTTVTCSPAARRSRAAVSPATPEPTTTTSVVSAQPGSGARSRRGSVGRSIPSVFDICSRRQRAGPEIANCATYLHIRRGVAAERLVAAEPGVGGGRPDEADLEIGPGGALRQSEVGERRLAAALGRGGLDGGRVERRVLRRDRVRADVLAGVRLRTRGVPDGVSRAGDAADRERAGADALEAAGTGDVRAAAGAGGLHERAAEEAVGRRLDPVGEQAHLVVVPVGAEVGRAERAARPAYLREHQVPGHLGVVALGRAGLADQVAVDLPDVEDLGGVRGGARYRRARPRHGPDRGDRLDRPAVAHLRRTRRRLGRDRVTPVDPPHPGTDPDGDQPDRDQPPSPRTRHASP